MTPPEFTAAEWGRIAAMLAEYAQARKRTLLKREDALVLRRRIVDACRDEWDRLRGERGE